MGRHKTRYDKTSENKRRRSSSSSRSDDGKRKNERFEQIERMVKDIEWKSHGHSSCIHRGDELMIPPFDPTKDDMTIEKWIQHVDELSKQYGWNDRAIMRLIPSRLKGHARQWYDTRPQLAIAWAETKKS